MVATAKSELAEIKRFGGKAQPNSGRGKHKKGDAIIDKFVVDVKEYARSFGLSIPMWSKVCTDAVRQGKRPALNVVLGEGKNRVRVWVISESDMMEYLKFLDSDNEE